MEALDQAEGLADSQREMPLPPPPSPPSEPTQKPTPQGTRSHSLTVRSSLCLLAASQFLVRASQEMVCVKGQPSSSSPILLSGDTERRGACVVPLIDLQPLGWHEEKAGVLSYSLDS